ISLNPDIKSDPTTAPKTVRRRSGDGFRRGVAPIFLPESPQRPLIKLMLMVGTVCCYAMWLTTYLAQLNPLFGPQVNNQTMALMRKVWS
ncbi:unnamed protein product, partial [Medioppia subpectinata]